MIRSRRSNEYSFAGIRPWTMLMASKQGEQASRVDLGSYSSLLLRHPKVCPSADLVLAMGLTP